MVTHLGTNHHGFQKNIHEIHVGRPEIHPKYASSWFPWNDHLSSYGEVVDILI